MTSPSTGAPLWRLAGGGSCRSGAAISGCMLYRGPGYGNFSSFFGTSNHRLHAFGLP